MKISFKNENETNVSTDIQKSLKGHCQALCNLRNVKNILHTEGAWHQMETWIYTEGKEHWNGVTTLIQIF